PAPVNEPAAAPPAARPCWPWWLVLAVLFFAGIRAAYELPLLDVRIAHSGWGPQQYVTQALRPGEFVRDWPNGIQDYDHSAPMRLFVWLAREHGISPGAALPWFVGLQLVFYSFALAYLALALFGDPAVAALVVP